MNLDQIHLAELETLSDVVRIEVEELEVTKLIEKLHLRLKESYQREEYLEQVVRELRREKFRRFNDEECWIWNSEHPEDNYLDSLICPVVICPKELKRLIRVNND